MLKKKEFFENPLEDLFTRKHLTSTIWHEIKMNGSIKYIFNDLNPKTSNLIILKEAIIKKKRIFRRTNSTYIHYSFILLNIFLTTSL